MGAWGVQPMQDDNALDWVSNYVEEPLVERIEKTLKVYLKSMADEEDSDEDVEDQDDDVEEAEAEACVALLIDFTGVAIPWKYGVVDIRFQVNERKLWDLAVKVVDRMIKFWKEQHHTEKIAVLKTLKAELKKAKKDYKDSDK
jgi:hypothetical protein